MIFKKKKYRKRRAQREREKTLPNLKIDVWIRCFNAMGSTKSSIKYDFWLKSYGKSYIEWITGTKSVIKYRRVWLEWIECVLCAACCSASIDRSIGKAIGLFQVVSFSSQFDRIFSAASNAHLHHCLPINWEQRKNISHWHAFEDCVGWKWWR